MLKYFCLILLHAHFQLFERQFQCQAYGRNFRGLFPSHFALKREPLFLTGILTKFQKQTTRFLLCMFVNPTQRFANDHSLCLISQSAYLYSCQRRQPLNRELFERRFFRKFSFHRDTFLSLSLSHFPLNPISRRIARTVEGFPCRATF